MKKLIFILVAFLLGCHHDKSDRNLEVSTALPLAEGIYELYPLGMGSAYTELSLDNSGDISANLYIFDSEAVVYVGTDDSVESGGKLYVAMTEEGWEHKTTEDQRKYLLNENDHLVFNGPFVKKICVNVKEESLSQQSIMSGVGEDYVWAEAYIFSDEAKKYTCDQIFTETTRVVEPIYCGVDCWGILSLGGGELSEWIDGYKAQDLPNASSGFYWLGMSLFFTDNGKIEIYSFFDHPKGMLSKNGTWMIVSINGEEVLEMDIPVSIKREFGIIDEASPIITKVMGTRFEGVRYESTYSRKEFLVGKKYYFNSAAIEDIKSAYISSLN